MSTFDMDLETKILTVIAPTTAVWAVFTAQDGEEDVWAERVHLWAHTRTGISPQTASEEEFLEREVPPARDEIQGLVIMPDGGGDLALAKETGEWLFLGYCETATPRVEDWRQGIRSVRRRFEREMQSPIRSAQ